VTPQELYQAEMARRRERYTASVAAVLAATSRAIEEQTEDPLDRFQSVPDRAAVPAAPTDAPAPVLLFVRGASAKPLTKKAQRAAASREATVRRAEAREAQRRAALTPAATVRDVRAAAEAEIVLAHAATATDYADLARRSGVAVPTIWRLIREGALSLPARWRVPRRK
jgi:hypothetical protein